MNSSSVNEVPEGTRADARPRWIMAFALLFAGALLAETGLAWSYVAKRELSDQPFVDLLETYYVLRPTRSWFPDQYPFPPVLQPNLVGEIRQAAAQRQFWLADPVLGRRLDPNALIVEMNYTWRATNAQGLIVTDDEQPLRTYVTPKPGNVFRIVVLGGSVIEGDGATGSFSALPGQLLAELRRNYVPANSTQSEFEVINAGVGGYTVEQELPYFLSELARLQPDLVVTVDGYADLVYMNLLIERFGPDFPLLVNADTEGHTRTLSDAHEWRGLARMLQAVAAARAKEVLGGFALFDVMGRALEQLRMRAAVPDTGTPLEYRVAESSARYVEYERLLAQAVLQTGAQFAWVLQPLGGLGRPTTQREKDYVQQNTEMVDVRRAFFSLAAGAQDALVTELPANRLCAVDARRVFDATDGQVFEDLVHLVDRGNKILAQEIARRFDRCGLIRTRF